MRAARHDGAGGEPGWAAREPQSGQRGSPGSHLKEAAAINKRYLERDFLERRE